MGEGFPAGFRPLVRAALYLINIGLEIKKNRGGAYRVP